MSIRQEAREYALQFLFQCDFNDEEIEQAWTDFWTGKRTGKKVRQFARELADGVLADRYRIDGMIQDVSDNWRLNRMAAVDRNLMRIAVFEMISRDDIPPVVSINEAVRLAKEYGTPESGRFVNGILDQILKSLKRPHRTVSKEA